MDRRLFSWIVRVGLVLFTSIQVAPISCRVRKRPSLVCSCGIILQSAFSQSLRYKHQYVHISVRPRNARTCQARVFRRDSVKELVYWYVPNYPCTRFVYYDNNNRHRPTTVIFDLKRPAANELSRFVQALLAKAPGL